MYESGFASKEDIDQRHGLGCAHPMGPLALADLIGLDTLLAVSESLYEEFRDPSSVAPALLNRMVEAGLLGRKTGRGFYDYSQRRSRAQPGSTSGGRRPATCRRGAPTRRSAGNTFDRLTAS